MEKKMSRQERERVRLIETIVLNAQDLFGRYGYENTTIDALAASSEYTKRTIYMHFAGKEDLYFAVMLRGHDRLRNAIASGIKNGQTGLTKIKFAYKAFFDFFAENGWLFDLMAQIKSIKSKKNPDELPYYQKYSECIRLLYQEITALFVLAHDDKSIRTDVDPRDLCFSSAFLLNGFLHMFNLSGDSFTQYFALDKGRFIGLTADLLFEILEGKRNE
jgi:AcrR family transcriptional regulator